MYFRARARAVVQVELKDIFVRFTLFRVAMILPILRALMRSRSAARMLTHRRSICCLCLQRIPLPLRCVFLCLMFILVLALSFIGEGLDAWVSGEETSP